MSERDFLLELDDEIDQIHDQADERTKELLWELRCKVDERIRKLYRQEREVGENRNS